ncbi:vacuolar protein sorting-associated protein 37A [Exaiptasia diaphana]|uniref:VPS37 C-terminal domain-containing protein n=1 Tax=Exaiptasia diaphana TaxID=2652724 RepID=A0A913XFJ3_EXADI|nr:vacuolar protein sorting-associated protein 37A [Exaiptasia diaphana]KXJ26226.1 Vacuolar protein sorting-associated protein 37A [Exaiptasia diaphana]
MSWMNIFSSSSAPKSSIPPTTALQQQRLKQIDTLKNFHHNVTEVQRDIEYRITFYVHGATMSFNVTLPPQFPNEKPVVTVSPPIQHPWVNDQMVVVGCPSLNMFYMHSNLGKAIQDVIKEFCDGHPPQFLTPPSSTIPGSLPSSNLSGYQPSSTSSFTGYQPLANPYSPMSFSPSSGSSTMFSGLSGTMTSTVMSTQVDSSNNARRPVVSSEFPGLNGLSLKELKDLNDDVKLIDEFIKNNMESLKQLHEKKDQVIKENEEIARYNLSLQPKFEACKDSILQCHALLAEKTQNFAQQSQKQKDLSETYSLRNIHTNMEVAASEADQDSEEIADRYLLGEIKTDEFIQTFMEKRKLCHLRRAKEEKLRNIHTHF